MYPRGVEILVGLFVLLAATAVLILALRVSGLTDTYYGTNGYQVTAEFDNIGGLQVGSPVNIAGVKVGVVKNIRLDPDTFRAQVKLQIFSQAIKLPQDTTASIYTLGILGAQYVSLMPGFADKNLPDHGVIETTHSALVLEHLVGQFMFNLKSSK